MFRRRIARTDGFEVLNFPPVGEVSIPDYELQKLSVPPILRIMRYLESQDFDEYIISTPGPVGLLAIFAAKLYQVPVRSIYHSDFPQHVRQITGDEGLEKDDLEIHALVLRNGGRGVFAERPLP